MQSSQIPPEKLGLAKRDANRTWPSSRIVNSWLPAIQAGPKSLRSSNRLRKATSPDKDEPFNYHSLLKEIGNREAEAQHLLGPSNADHTNLKTSDGTTAIRNGTERCASCIRLAKSQREAADSLQVARNVIESLEASVSLLQARLALYDGGKEALGRVVARSNEDKLPPSAQERTTTSVSSGFSSDETKSHNNSRSAERTATSTENGAGSLDPVPATEPPFASTDVTTLKQNDRQTPKDTAQTLIAFGGTIRALAAVMATQSKQIEQLKSSNTELATHETLLAKKLKAAEAGQRNAQETVLFQAEAMIFLAKELQAQRIAAEYGTARLLCAIRHERSERRAAERDMTAIKNELTFLLPKLTTASKSLEQGHSNKQMRNLGFRTEIQPNGHDSCNTR